MRRRFIIAALLFIGLQACTVIENREPCPGTLIVDIADIRERLGDGSLRVDVISDDEITSISRFADVSQADTMRFFIPKKVYTVCAAAGQKNTTFAFPGMALGASGRQSDSIYAFSNSVNVNGEITDFDAEFHKQFATVRIINSFATGEEDPFDGMSLTVRSMYCGLNYRSMAAAGNVFTYTVQPDKDYAYSFRMPRQGDDSITLEIVSPGLQHSVPIGRFLSEMGYNFNAEELQDVTVGVDLVSMNVRIVIEDWYTEQIFAII